MKAEQKNLILADIIRQNRYLNLRMKYKSELDDSKKRMLRHNLQGLAKTIEDKEFLKKYSF